MKGFKELFKNVAILAAGLSIVLVFGYFETAAQSPKRKTAPASKASGNSPVVSRFIKAMQERDFKTIIDLTYSYQLQLDAIRKQQPRALWEKKVNEFYDSKIETLTQESSFWGNYFLGLGSMMEDPAQNYRAIAYLLPLSSRWKVSEVRKETVTSIIQGPFPQTAVYISVNYPLGDGTPVFDKRFLKSTMLKFGLRNGSLVENTYHVSELNEFWEKPYPKGSAAFLIEKLKNDIRRGDKTAVAELTEVGGWNLTESFLLEIAGQYPPYEGPFNIAVETLAASQNSRVIPYITSALKGRSATNILDPRGGWMTNPDKNLIQALQRIGKSDAVELVSILKDRLSQVIGGWDTEWTNEHLKALASIDDPAWSSLPYRAFEYSNEDNYFEELVAEVAVQQKNSPLVAFEGQNVGRSNAFLDSLLPCNARSSSNCQTRLLIGKLRFIDPNTIELSGGVERKSNTYSYKKSGDYKMVLFRKETPTNKWAVKEIDFVEGTSYHH